jgi:hypothetical protein
VPVHHAAEHADPLADRRRRQAPLDLQVAHVAVGPGPGLPAHAQADQLGQHLREQRVVAVGQRRRLRVRADHLHQQRVVGPPLGPGQQLSRHDSALEQREQLLPVLAGLVSGVEGVEERPRQQPVRHPKLRPRTADLHRHAHGARSYSA